MDEMVNLKDTYHKSALRGMKFRISPGVQMVSQTFSQECVSKVALKKYPDQVGLKSNECNLMLQYLKYIDEIYCTQYNYCVYAKKKKKKKTK